MDLPGPAKVPQIRQASRQTRSSKSMKNHQISTLFPEFHHSPDFDRLYLGARNELFVSFCFVVKMRPNSRRYADLYDQFLWWIQIPSQYHSNNSKPENPHSHLLEIILMLLILWKFGFAVWVPVSDGTGVLRILLFESQNVQIRHYRQSDLIFPSMGIGLFL